jgi:hypothetical protein
MEIVKINPYNVTLLYRFLRNLIVMNGKDYDNFVNLKAKNSRFNVHDIEVIPHKLLIPLKAYSTYTFEFLTENLGASVEKQECIGVENLSQFTVYNLPVGSRDIMVKIIFRLSPSHTEPWRNVAKLEEVGIILKVWKDNTFKQQEFRKTFDKYDGLEVKRFDSKLRMFSAARGKKFSDINKRNGEIALGILDFEEDWFILANAFYTLYSGFKGYHNIDNEALKPFADAVRSLGDTFEEVLEKVIAIAMPL